MHLVGCKAETNRAFPRNLSRERSSGRNGRLSTVRNLPGARSIGLRRLSPRELINQEERARVTGLDGDLRRLQTSYGGEETEATQRTPAALSSTSPRAQRLSASLNSAPHAPGGGRPALRRAQRLSASLNSARLAMDELHFIGIVLNAFRHH